MDSLNITPMNNYVLVLPDDRVEKIGSIFLPEKSKVKTSTGIVLKVSAFIKDCEVKPGDYVTFPYNKDYNKYVYEEGDEKQDLLFVPIDDISAIINREKKKKNETTE